jgi:oligopeptide/dipeptide ABC transporter ATP-binding protein
LQVDDLRTYFYTEEGVVRAVDGVSFSLEKGETLGIVGESGCGKSVTALSVMQLIPRPGGRIVGGKILYRGKSGEVVDITALDPRKDDIRKLRGNEIGMVFQEPMTALHPVYTVGQQICEAVVLHEKVDKKTARDKAIRMLEMVGISAPERRIDAYPHEMSGGMRQRVMIAMSLSCNPGLLIADEPTTALDVTIEAQILELMEGLQQQLGMSIMFITHDLQVIGEMSNNVVVMYAGKIVEAASIDDIYHNSKHPYTRGLLRSIPRIGVKGRLVPIKGSVPSLAKLPSGCHFAPRCPHMTSICGEKEPPECETGESHRARCWLYAGGQVTA